MTYLDNKKTIVLDPLGILQVLDEDKKWIFGYIIEDNLDNYNIDYETFYKFVRDTDKISYEYLPYEYKILTNEYNINDFIIKYYKKIYKRKYDDII
jgi:hypothetical protein